MHEAIDEVGAGSGGTRNISGTTHYHVELEAEIADLHRKEAALLFTSAYIANDATLSTLTRLIPGLVIFSDAKNHASMIEGIRHGGGAKHIFRNNDIGHLEDLLKAVPLETPKIIAFESVYSMDGHISPIAAICDLAEKYNALTYLDEVHAVGLYGPAAAASPSARVSWTASTSSTARWPRASASWAAISPPRQACCDAIRSYAPGFIFTTSLAPAVAAGALASMRHLKGCEIERARHKERVRTLKSMMATAKPSGDGQSEPHRAGDGGRSGPLQGGHRYAADPLRDLCAADQLSDRAPGHRAHALHPFAGALPRRRWPTSSARSRSCGPPARSPTAGMSASPRNKKFSAVPCGAA